jgi:phosphinothricin acetyltransferase
MKPHLRVATINDLQAINSIYNHYVSTCTCTYQMEPDPEEERQEWFQHHGPEYPILVVEVDGKVVGWGSISPYHSRCGYKATVEDSIYIRHDMHGCGLGKLILGELLERAKNLKYHTMIALISADQPGSIGLHRKMGFEKVAHLREVGRKFDRWLDVVFMQKML